MLAALGVRVCVRVRVLALVVFFALAGLGLGPSTAWAAGHWSKSARLFPGSATEIFVSCSSSRFCAAVGYEPAPNQDVARVYTRGHWRDGTRLPGSTGQSYTPELNSISCVSSKFCVVAGLMPDGDGEFWYFNGSSWRVQTGNPMSDDSISCVSRDFCMAYGMAQATAGPPSAEIYNGKSWTPPQKIDSTYGVVSCPSTSFCEAFDTAGRALTYRHGSWSKPKTVDPSERNNPGYEYISCPSSKFCLAVGRNTFVVRRGTSWGSPGHIKHGGLADGESCASRSFCVEINDTGDANMFNGSKWTSKVVTRASLLSVSCASTRFCAAFDDLGRLYLYK